MCVAAAPPTAARAACRIPSLLLRGLLAGVLLLAPALASAQPALPQALAFQGQLLDADGIPVPGPVDLSFGVWADPVSSDPGQLRYEEEHTGVDVGPGGAFGVALGAGAPLSGGFGGAIFDGPLWVEVTVDGETLAPRLGLTSVPYAFRAEDADHLGGVPASDWQRVVKGRCKPGEFATEVQADGALLCAKGGAGGLAADAPLVGDGSAATPLGVAPGGIGLAHLAPASVDGARIVDFSVGTADVAIGAIQGPHILDGSITSNDIADETILNTDIQVGAVRTSEIQDGQVMTADLADGAVTTAKLATASVDSLQIAPNAVGASEIAANAVGSSEIAANAVGSSEIAAGAVGNSELGIGLSYYSWTASNSSSSYTASLGAHEFCAVTFVLSGSQSSSDAISNFLCAVYPSSVAPGSWVIEARGNISTRCDVRCF